MTREVAIEILKDENERQGHFKGYSMYSEALEMAISALSKEDDTMEWIRKPNIYGVTYCSKCDYENKVDDTNFCPNCGRKAVNK